MEYEGLRIPVRARQVVLAGFGLLALLLLAGVAAHGWGEARLGEVLARAEAGLGPLDPAAYAPPPVPPEGDVAVRLEEVATMLDAVPVDDPDARLLRLSHRDPATWTAEDREAMGRFLLPRAAALARARGLASLEGGRFDPWRGKPLLDTDLEPELLQGGRLLRLHALFAAAEGQPEMAVGSLAALGRLAEALYAQSTRRTFAAATMAETDQIVTLHALLAAGVSDPETLDRLERTLVPGAPFDPLRRATGFEVARAVRLTRDDGGAAVRWNTPLHWRLAVAVAWEWLLAESLEALLEVESAGRVPLPDLRAATAGADAARGAPLERPSADLLLLQKAYEIALGRQLARQALALARVGARTGRYPLDPGPLPRDPVGGGPLVHRPLEDGSVQLAAPSAEEPLAGAPGLSRVPLEWTLPPLEAPSP